jgi:hypothetical protein
MIDEYGAFGVVGIGRGNWSTRRKPTPAPLCPSALFKHGIQNRYKCPFSRPISVSYRFLFKLFYSQNLEILCTVQVNSWIYILTVQVRPTWTAKFQKKRGSQLDTAGTWSAGNNSLGSFGKTCTKPTERKTVQYGDCAFFSDWVSSTAFLYNLTVLRVFTETWWRVRIITLGWGA